MMRSLPSLVTPTQSQSTMVGELPYYVLLAALKTHWRIETPAYLLTSGGYHLSLRPNVSLPLPLALIWFWATIVLQRPTMMMPLTHWLATALRSGAFLLIAPDTAAVNRLVRSQRLRVVSVPA